ncbi:MAG TPA: hypothetical protein VN936_10680 [Candidatus Acidoferrum sp.]|nr:hypothetical protein [Candidatus Acidoferrum sp.]
MKSYFGALIGGALLCFAAAVCAPAAAAICAPAKLVHVEVVPISPAVDPASFGAQPRNFYRLGSSKMRTEEALDAPNGIHGLIVADEPDIWMVNLYDHTGKHIVDPGPTFNVKAPVLGANLPSKLMELEYGCEADYIAANAPTPVRSETLDGVTYDVFRVSAGSDAVEILERPDSGIPTLIRYYHNGTVGFALRYNVYQAGLPDDPSLFAKPSGIQYTEAH